MNDRNAPATKGDVTDLRNELRDGIAEFRNDMRTQVDQVTSEANHRYNDLVERINDGETRLLKAFYSFAESNQKRVVELDGNEAALRSRMGSFEARLLEVEKRLNIPPAA